MKVEVFKNEQFGEIRVLEKDGEPWFVGKDVAKMLGYSNSRDALKKHIDEDDKGVAKCDTLRGKQILTIVNESGLYSLILSSKLTEAKKIKRWVTNEVLPTIRKHGIHKVVKGLKGFSSKVLRENFPHLKSSMPTLWTNSYFCGTVGSVSLEVVKQYI
ncbi:transposase [Clostridioides sp. ES-S-0049-02]|nr:transposase [Clostridioides sp. ES-S-0049-02]